MFTFFYAYLQLLIDKRAVQDKGTVITGISRNSCDFLDQQVYFVLEISSVRGTVGAISRLNRKFTHSLQHVRDFCDCAFNRLRHGDAVVRILNSHI